MTPETESILDLVRSNSEENQEIGVQILKGKGFSDIEVVRFFRDNEIYITEERAVDAGVLSGTHYGTLMKCIKCEGEDFKINTLDTLQGMSCEEEHICKKCNELYYWGYGHYDLNGFC